MKLNAPHKIIFLISLIVTALAVVSHYYRIEYITAHTFGLLVIGYVLLIVACLIPGSET
jgi:hypothetical protein